LFPAAAAAAAAHKPLPQGTKGESVSE
jgi:hypothetical protein